MYIGLNVLLGLAVLHVDPLYYLQRIHILSSLILGSVFGDDVVFCEDKLMAYLKQEMPKKFNKF